jgi:hypothetical protein
MPAAESPERVLLRASRGSGQRQGERTVVDAHVALRASKARPEMAYLPLHIASCPPLRG